MEHLDSVVRLSSRVLRVLGQNPGKFTLQGTNTYLIGSGPPYILLDAGDGVDAYIPILESALRESVAQQLTRAGSGSRLPSSPHGGVHPLVSDIIISHRHHDHHAGLPSILSLLHRMTGADTAGSEEEPANASSTTKLEASDVPSTIDDTHENYVPPRIHKLPSPWDNRPSLFASESKGLSFEATLKAISELPPLLYEKRAEHDEGSLSSAPPSSTASAAASPLPLVHDLVDGQILHTTPNSVDGETISLKVLHTPGHTTDSISLLLPSEGAMFTADTVLGEGTAIFEDLGVYICSLQLMKEAGQALLHDKSPEQREHERAGGLMMRIYPGHGPVIEDGMKTLETYIQHRNEREAQILSLLPTSAHTPAAPTDSTSGADTIASIVQILYAKYPPAVWPAAEHSVWLHMQKLEREGRVGLVQEGSSEGLRESTVVGGDMRTFYEALRKAVWRRKEGEDKSSL